MKKRKKLKKDIKKYLRKYGKTIGGKLEHLVIGLRIVNPMKERC